MESLWYLLIVAAVVIVRVALTSGARSYKSGAAVPRGNAHRPVPERMEPESFDSHWQGDEPGRREAHIYTELETPVQWGVSQEENSPRTAESSAQAGYNTDLQSMVIAQTILNPRGGRRPIG